MTGGAKERKGELRSNAHAPPVHYSSPDPQRLILGCGSGEMMQRSYLGIASSGSPLIPTSSVMKVEMKMTDNKKISSLTLFTYYPLLIPGQPPFILDLPLDAAVGLVSKPVSNSRH